jgi:hypothetical protein
MKAQQPFTSSMGRGILILLVTVLALPALARMENRVEGNSATEPAIKITSVPPRGEGPTSNGNIVGTVSGVNVKECKVVIFARTDRWYVQPMVADPYTVIGSDGHWEADIHLGYEYAALLVTTGYEPPATIGILPKVTGRVLAIDRVPAKIQ